MSRLSVAIEFLCRAHILVAHACLSCAPRSVVGENSTPLPWPALSRLESLLSRHNFSLLWPTLSRHKNALSRHNFSLPWPTLSRRKNTRSRQEILPAWTPMSQPKIPCHNTKPPFGHTMSRHKILCRDTKSLPKAKLCRDIETSLDQLCHDVKCCVVTQGPLVLATLCRDITCSVVT